MNELQILAHMQIVDGNIKKQSLKSHSYNTAKYAQKYGADVGLGNTCYFIGLIHDFGKANPDWQNRLFEVVEKKNEKIGIVHTFAAVRFMLDEYYAREEKPKDKLIIEIMAIAAGSHHSLFDLVAPFRFNSEHGLKYRAEYEDYDYIKTRDEFYECVISKNELDELYEASKNELTKFISNIEENQRVYKKKGMYFMHAFLVRMLISCVMEGDRRDTAEFYDGRFKSFEASVDFWQKQLAFMEKKISQFKCDTPLNEVRSYISDKCKEQALKIGNIYRLTVPTGGGKTLASIRYSLTHSANFGKRRIFYFIPLLSILDQNSKEIHKYMADADYVLEHHSNVVYDFESKEELERNEFLTDTWESPVIISTMVQLLNVLFSQKTSAIRRLKSLCNSVIVIDEIQSLPLKFSCLFNMAINFLAKYCNTTVILCSATQPPNDALDWNLLSEGESELVTLTQKQQEVFKRVKIENRIDEYGMSIKELADFTIQEIENKDSILIICNTKRECRELFEALKDIITEEVELYHLSTSMCRAHREMILDKIGKTPGLNESRKVICISTQLVEAGIDFSFQTVIRIWAGLDSIIQAAGRCNRNNDWKELCMVYVINLKNEMLKSLKYIEEGQNAFRSISIKNRGRSYIDDKTIKDYYIKLYNSDYAKRESKYPIKIDKEECFMINLLSTNGDDYKDSFILHQAFKTAGENCKVFDDDKIDVIVPYNEVAVKHMMNLSSLAGSNDFAAIKRALKELQPYIVSIFDYELHILDQDGMIDRNYFPGIIVLEKAAYHEDIGVSPGNYILNNDILSI